jgi:hypothetical protein
MLAMLMGGCLAPAGPGSHAGEPYLVNTQRTLFYSFGPAQTTGPDFALYKGQRLTMLSRSYGYSHVALEGGGQSGYVATEDLVPGPPAPHPSPTATPGASSRSGHRRHAGGGSPGRTPSAAEQSQVPLLPEFPESKPPPGAPPFRY